MLTMMQEKDLFGIVGHAAAKAGEAIRELRWLSAWYSSKTRPRIDPKMSEMKQKNKEEV